MLNINNNNSRCCICHRMCGFDPRLRQWDKRIQCCDNCGIGSQVWFRFNPWLGNVHVPRGQPKKKKKCKMFRTLIRSQDKVSRNLSYSLSLNKFFCIYSDPFSSSEDFIPLESAPSNAVNTQKVLARRCPILRTIVYYCKIF